MEEFSLIANRVLKECHSTNDLIRRLGLAGYPHGTWVSSLKQTRGKGRGGRKWISEEGNLYLSLLIRDFPAERWTWTPLLTGMLISEKIEILNEKVSIQLKWPNDLIATDPDSGEDSKLGGILCEGVQEGGRAFIVVGIGLNVKSAPGSVDQPSTYLEKLISDPVDLEQLREEVRRAVDSGLRDAAKQEIDSYRERFFSRAYFQMGETVQWSNSLNGSEQREGPNTRVFSGRVLGLGPYGELLVQTEEGHRQSLFAADLNLKLHREKTKN